MKNFLHTFRFLLVCFWRRFLYQLGDLFTLIVTSTAIFGLIFYIGSDFAEISSRVFNSEILHKLKFFFVSLAVPAGLLLSINYGRGFLKEDSDWLRLSVFLVPQRAISQYLRVRRVVGFFLLVLAWFLFVKWILLTPWDDSEKYWFVLVGFISLLLSLLIPILDRFGKNLAQQLMIRWVEPLRWRLIQLVYHAGNLGLVWLILLIGYGLAFTCIFLKLPYLLTTLAAFLAAAGWGYCLCFEAAKSVQWTWIEKAAGFSHAHFVKIYRQLSSLFLIIHIVVIAVFYLLASQEINIFELFKIAFISSTPILLFSCLMFQIDVLRPNIQFAVLLLLAFFLSTAMLAHIAAGLLLPLIDFYAAKYQFNRYYRI